KGAVIVVLAVFFVEGGAVAARDVRDAGKRSDYAALSHALQHELPPGSSALGDNRLWPALQAYDLRSWLLLFYFTNPEVTRDQATNVDGALQRIDPDYLLISPLTRQMLAGLIPRDAADFQAFLANRTEEVASIPDHDYGPIEIYRVKK